MKTNSEIWKPVVGWEGSYEISDFGNVRSVNRLVKNKWGTMNIRKQQAIRSKPNIRCGYPYVILRRDGKSKTVKCHTLVLTAFAGPRPPNMEACHNNGVRTDNRLSNLRWGTRKENVQDRFLHGTNTVGVRNGRAVLDDNSVRSMRMMLSGGMLQKDAATLFGVSKSLVGVISQGIRWSHVKDQES